jgi:hypothetical protein
MDGWNITQNQEQPAGFEFEPERFFDTFISVAKMMLVKPREFFRQLPVTATLKNPLVFLAFCSFITALLVANARGGGGQLFAMLCCANIFSTLIGSITLHLLVKKMYRSQAPFGATLRVLAYASLMDTVSWIPLLGPFAYFYGLYLVFIGIQEQHRVTPRQAALAVIIIVCIVTALAMSIMLISPESFTESLKMLDPQQGDTGF